MFGIEDTRQPEFRDHSECDDCGALFDNSDLYDLPGRKWLCDDCRKIQALLERQEWLSIKRGIAGLEREIEIANDKYGTLINAEVDDLINLLEQAWAMVNKAQEAR